MNVSLNPRLENFIQEQLENGRFSNASEVVREGLRLLEEREMKIIELRREIQKGLDSGSSGPWDKEAFLSNMRAKASKKGISLDQSE